MSFYECSSGTFCVSHRLIFVQQSFLLVFCSSLPNLGCRGMAFKGTD